MSAISVSELPSGSLLKAFPAHYQDSYVGTLISDRDVTIEDVVKVFFTASPPRVQNLMSLRNQIVKVFGLKAPDVDDSQVKAFEIRVGQSLGLFKVMDQNASEVIIGENDKHLDFRLSIHLSSEGCSHCLTISTVVHFHNPFGRLYFSVVKPFHKVIVNHMLGNILKSKEL